MRMREGTRARRVRAHGLRAIGATLALALGAAALGGCAAARNELGTAASSCYVDLPVALEAVHHHGKLGGVRLVTVASLRPHAPRLYRAALAERHRGSVCLLAFSGDFAASRVERPIGRGTGHLAVVELAYPTKRLLATLLVLRAPLSFGHYHL